MKQITVAYKTSETRRDADSLLCMPTCYGDTIISRIWLQTVIIVTGLFFKSRIKNNTFVYRQFIYYIMKTFKPETVKRNEIQEISIFLHMKDTHVVLTN